MSSDDVVLALFVRGCSSHSAAAIELVRRLCEEHLSGRCQLEVIDIVDQPDRVKAAGVVAVPALVRLKPEPVLRTVGQLTEARALTGMGIELT